MPCSGKLTIMNVASYKDLEECDQHLPVNGRKVPTPNKTGE